LDSSKKIYTFVKKDIESLINENLNKWIIQQQNLSLL
jgi:hypothetical protein